MTLGDHKVKVAQLIVEQMSLSHVLVATTEHQVSLAQDAVNDGPIFELAITIPLVPCLTRFAHFLVRFLFVKHRKHLMLLVSLLFIVTVGVKVDAIIIISACAILILALNLVED